jgi:hypothetical protein
MEFSKKIKRLIREFLGEAYERELHRELTKLDQSFAAWRSGSIGSGELSDRIHQFEVGPARELWKQYNNRGYEYMSVAYAVVTGILSRDEVPAELLEALEQPMAFYEDLKARDDLLMPEERLRKR